MTETQEDDRYKRPEWMNDIVRHGRAAAFLRPPPWLIEHPAVRGRGITELPLTMKPAVVFSTNPHPDKPSWVIKIVQPGTPEVEIYEHLLKNGLSSPNHTLPVDIVHNEPPLLIMPGCQITGCTRFTRWTLREAVDDFYQLVEGVEYLHRNNVAHMDLNLENTTIATENTVKHQKQLELNKIYIIDYGFSCLFELGPCAQPPVDIEHLALSEQHGVTRLDAYSWDVLCLGDTLLRFAQMMFPSVDGKPKSIPWICTRYARWLVGKEKGCAGVCRCRPTARRALQVLAVIRRFVHGWDAFQKAFGYMVGLCGLRQSR